MSPDMRSHYPRLLVILALLIGSDSVAGQSLADVARAEEVRRKTIKEPAKVYTDGDLKGGGAAAAPAPTSPMPPGMPTSIAGIPVKPGMEKPAPKDQPKTDEPKTDESKAAEPKKDEKTERAIAALRNALTRNKILADALQSRINALNTDFVNRDDPIQRAGIEKDRRAALAELDRVKQDIEKSNQAIAALEEEARKAGVPPGWLR
jgi:hypothetical protein